ncbi:MAG TPA: type 1 glutamine amidotransferase domain-containing protein [Gaiellaceae bacterium]
MAAELQGKKIAFIATEGVEEAELVQPWQAVERAGGRPELVSIEEGEVQAWQHFDKGGRFKVDKTIEEAQVGEYDGLVLPGGVANPDQLRLDENVVSFIRDFATSGKPIGVICHGPWTLIEAGVVEGRTLTSWPSLQTDLRNAGARWVDQEVVVDRGLVSSRKPDDLPAFNAKILEEFAEGKHSQSSEQAPQGSRAS